MSCLCSVALYSRLHSGVTAAFCPAGSGSVLLDDCPTGSVEPSYWSCGAVQRWVESGRELRDLQASYWSCGREAMYFVISHQMTVIMLVAPPGGLQLRKQRYLNVTLSAMMACRHTYIQKQQVANLSLP